MQDTLNQNIKIIETDLPPTLKGLYVDGLICISEKLKTRAEKESVIAEELGHYYTTEGDILDQTDLSNVKQEETARRWAYDFKVPLSSLVEAYEAHLDHYDLIDMLDVTEEFFLRAMDYHRAKYGNYADLGDYIIYFDPLGVMKKF